MRNWAFTDTWLHPATGETLGRADFKRLVFRPLLVAHLRQFGDEVARLRAAWTRGELLITEAMKEAHGHLNMVEEIVAVDELD